MTAILDSFHKMIRIQRLQLQLINGAEPVLLQEVFTLPPSLEQAAGALRWR
jgi:hypothetical protein